MKKTIAILLVLVIGMAGVFAAEDASLKLTTTVNTLNEFKITQLGIDQNSTHDYSAYTALDVRSNTAVSRDEGMADTAFITIANNSPNVYSVGVKASKLAATDENITTLIGYTVSVGSANNVAALDPTSAANSTTYTEAITVSGTVGEGITIASEEISVDIVTNDYDSAAAGSYEGFIYFNITAI